MKPHIRTALTLLGMFACGQALADASRLPYRCDNGSQVDITFAQDAEGRPLALLHFADETVTLPQTANAGSPLFRSGEIRLSTQDDEVMLEDGKGNLRHCKQGHQVPVTSTPPADSGSFLTLAGTLRLATATPWPAKGKLTLRVIDKGRPRPLTLVEQQYELNAVQAPIPFAATLDRDLIGKRSRLSIEARVDVGGKIRFIGQHSDQVHKPGQTENLEIALRPVGRSPR